MSTDQTQPTESQQLSAELVKSIAAGDTAAEKKLLETFYRPVLALLRYRCRDQALAEDLCQDTFRIVIEHLRETPLDNPQALNQYLRQVATNLFIGEIRRVQRQDTYPDMDSIDMQVAEDISAYDQVVRKQQQQSVTRLLDELKIPRDRQILRMHYLADLDKSVICKRLELSPEHFDRVIYRAKQRLRELYEQENSN